MMRATREHIKNIASPEVLEIVINDIERMHSCKSEAQFLALKDILPQTSGSTFSVLDFLETSSNGNCFRDSLKGLIPIRARNASIDSSRKISPIASAVQLKIIRDIVMYAGEREKPYAIQRTPAKVLD